MQYHRTQENRITRIGLLVISTYLHFGRLEGAQDGKEVKSGVWGCVRGEEGDGVLYYVGLLCFGKEGIKMKTGRAGLGYTPVSLFHMGV